MTWRAALLCLALSAGQGTAEAGDLPDRADIRSFYETHVTTPLPAQMIQALKAAEERHPAPHHVKSLIAAGVTRIMLPGRKSAERVVLSARMSQELSRDEPVQLYAALVEMGQGCHGMRPAALAYFDRPVEALGLAEMAFLAGLPRAPLRFDPSRAPERALVRRDAVLEKMAQVGFIPDHEARAAQAMPLGVRLPLERCARAEPAPLRPRPD